MSSQVKQVYYLPYACMDKSDLRDWWVAYHVSPRNYIPPSDINDDSDTPVGPVEMSFYQEDGLPGSFVIDLGIELDNINLNGSDEITDPDDLEFLSKLNAGIIDEAMDNLEGDEEYQDDLPQYAPNDPDDY